MTGRPEECFTKGEYKQKERKKATNTYRRVWRQMKNSLKRRRRRRRRFW